MTIAEDFAGFGSDITALRKKLRGAGCELHDSFPPYGAWFRRRFGIEHDQALELFHQTVSMKSVGNLTDFVRSHILEAFDVAPAASRHLIQHVRRPQPGASKQCCKRPAASRIAGTAGRPMRSATVQLAAKHRGILCQCRDWLRPWFASLKFEH